MLQRTLQQERERSAIPGRRYFAIVFIACSIMLMAFTAVIYRQSTISNKYNDEVIQSYELLRKARGVLNLTIDLETGQRGYLLTGNEPYLAPYNESLAALGREIEALKKGTEEESAQRKVVNEIEYAVRRVKAIMRDQILTYQIEGPSGITVSKLNLSKARVDSVRAAVEKFIKEEQVELKRRESAARRQNYNYFLTLFVGSALAVGGMVIANFIILRLIARQRKTEAELRHFEESYRLILEGANDGIFDYYPDSKLMYFSPSYHALLGYDAEEMPGHVDTLNKLIHPDDFQATWDLTERFMRKDTNDFTNVFRLKHKDGSWRWILARAVGIWDDNGTIRRLVGTHTDISQQKAYEEQLKQMNAELEGFTYIASHDLRAPLVNLKGFAGELERAYDRAKPILDEVRPGLDEEKRTVLRETFDEDIPEALGFIHSSVEKMDKLTSAILDLSRIGRRQYRKEAVDVNAMVKRCMDSLAFEMQEKGVEYVVDDFPGVVTDPLALEQIFSNLLDNAVKYLDPKRKGKIAVEHKLLPGEHRFSIVDNGRGIGENDRSRVFDIFRRAANSGDVRGIGMGMAYVKAMVRKLGGRIWFESTIDKGSTFYFTLPEKL